MKKRLSFIAVCIVVLALFLGANNIGCGSSNNAVAPPDETGDVVDDNSPSDKPAASETPYDPYYWVSAEGSDDNPGTQEKPFRTLYKAATECYETAPKDIHVYPGTYEEAQALFFPPNVSIYGLGSRTADPVKYRPVIDLRGCGSNDCSFFLSGSTSYYNDGSDVTIDGLKIYAERMGIWVYDTSLTLTNSEIIVSGDDEAVGISVLTSNTVTGFTMSDSTVTTEDLTDPNGSAQAISIYNGTCETLAIDILDSTIASGRGDGQSVGIFIANFSDCDQNILIKGNTISSSESSQISVGIMAAYSNELRIEQNRIAAGTVQDLPGTNRISAGVSIQSDSSHDRINATLLNNAIYGGSGGNDAYGVRLFDNIDALILFNTIDGGSGASEEATAIKSFEDVSTRAHNNILCAGTNNNNSYGIFEIRGNMEELSHNLFCQDLGVFYETQPENTFPHSYTDASLINAADPNFTDNVSGDPNFANFAAHDYHIVFPSDAVDAGTSIAGILHDLDGSARVRGQAPDAGAYELR